MEDLKAVFYGGIAFAAYGILGWICILALIKLLLLLFKGIGGAFRLNESLTRENPYIAQHKKILIDREQYSEYVNVARKDGFEIPVSEQEETAEEKIVAEENDNDTVSPNKHKKKKKKKE